MPFRKDQVERQAWQWAETTPPERIGREHVLAAYILLPPHIRKTACKRNCRHQPLCISGLGEQDWLQDSDVTRLYAGDREEPDMRPAQVPAGLKNLGATCYVNSLLQLWFHNRKFRRAILQWEPAADPVERLNDTLMTSQYAPLTPIGHLQLVFGYMHGGLLRTVDPSPFILSLRLDTMYQQDAQEFSKLFSTLLEEGLSHQSRPEVSGAVQHLMRGEYQYVTRCNECLQESTCPSYFYELDLQIQGQKQLTDCLAEFLREESLTGANQYNCQTCQCKRDASRAIRLTELPPVLNFQLMRFVFDRETGLKKKLSSHLRFPELLDVSEYVRQPACSVTYRLQAVLLHKGPSAYSGHYTAHICDSETGAWFRFNDEEVEKIKSLKLNAEDDLEDPVKKPKQTRCPKGYHSSNQAYMLVYSRVPEVPEANGAVPAPQAKAELRQAKAEAKARLKAEVEEMALPGHIQIMVDEMNSSVNAQVQQNEQAKSVSVEEYRLREREVREIYPRLPCSDVTQGVVLLPAAWLTAWLAGEPPGPVDTGGLLCRHGRLSPWNAAKVKCVDPGAGSLLTCLYGGSGLDASGLCETCVRSRCGAIRARHQLEEDAKTVTALLKEEIRAEDPAFWVGKTTLRIWKRLASQWLPQDNPPPAPAAAVSNGGSTDPSAASTGESTVSAATAGGSTASTAPATASVNPANATVTSASLAAQAANAAAPATIPSHSPNPTANSVNAATEPATSATSEPPSATLTSRKRPASPTEAEDAASPRRSPKRAGVRRPLATENRAVRLGLGGDVDVEMAVDAVENGEVNGGEVARCLSEAVANEVKPDVLGRRELCIVGKALKRSFVTDVKEEKLWNSSPMPVDSQEKTVNGDLGSSNGPVELSTVPKTEAEPLGDSPGATSVSVNASIGQASGGSSPSSATSLSAPVPSTCSASASEVTPAASTASSSTSTSSSTSASTSTSTSAPTTSTLSSSTPSTPAPRRPSFSRVNGQTETDSDSATRGQTAEDTSGPEEEEGEEEEFNGDLRCAHGGLCVEEGVRRLVPPSVWTILARYFPEAQPYSREQELCPQCREQVSEEEQMRQLYRQMAAEQRAALSDLYSDRLRPQVAAPACPSGQYHALGRQTTEIWRKFLKDPLKRDPANLESRSLLCTHGRLLYSPDHVEDRNRMVFLHDWEWDIVRRSGHDGCEVVITRREGDQTVTTQPEPCEECIQRRRTEERQRQLQYASTRIFIRKVESLEEEMEEMASKRLRLEGTAEPVRRSSRPRRAPGSKPLSVASTDTLRDLKVQIMKAFKVAPYDQHLMFNGVPLLDGLATLGHLGIVPGSTLLLQVDEASETVDPTASEDLTAAANPEMGFKGTGLVSS